MFCRELRSKFYTCAKFQSLRKFPQKYRFFWILSVFWKTTGYSECISENYAKRSILVPSFRAIANLRQNTGLSGFNRYFAKIQEILSAFLSFRVIGKFLRKNRFFGILPVFWKIPGILIWYPNWTTKITLSLEVSRKSANFCSFSPKPVRTLIISI